MPEVLSRSGVPIVSDFAHGKGTPLVVNDDNGRGYVLVNNVVTPLGGELYNVLDYASIEDALDATEVTGGTLHFPAGTYSYTTSPNFARAGVSITCDRDTLFVHTGTGNAFILDGGAATSGFFGNVYEHITVQGNSNSTNGMYVRGIHHARFVHPKIRGCATTGAGFLLEWCVCNEWNTPCVSANQGAFSSIPLIGMLLTRRGSGSEHTTTQTLINPVIEAVSGDGLKFDYTANNTTYGGTSEGNARGIYITSNSAGNEFHNLDMEGNTTEDVLCEGADHTFLGGLSDSSIRFSTASGSRNHVIGGRWNTITIEAATFNNSLCMLTYAIAGGSLTNASTNTSKYRVFNVNTQVFDTDLAPHNIIATASLPAAATSRDGTTIIEDAGAGDRNIIIYAGGQRFRIDGGAAF